MAEDEVGGAAILSPGENGRNDQDYGGTEKREHPKQLTLPRLLIVYRTCYPQALDNLLTLWTGSS
jgi:hypothetical protein